MKLNKVVAAALVAVTAAMSFSMFSGCYCQHKLKELAKVPSTCVEHGLRTAYECEKCGMLFGYSNAKGLYEITERELAPLGDHTIGKEFIGEYADETFKVSNKCAVCGEVVSIDSKNLFPFAPSDNVNGEHVRIGNTVATQFTFSEGSKADTTYVLMPGADSGSDPWANTEVPFKADVSRSLIMFAFNESDIDVDIVYGAEYYGARCLTEQTTIPAGGYAPLVLDINFGADQPSSYHELYLKQDIDREVKITLCGFYYDEAELQSLALPTGIKTRYEEGEQLDKENLALVATYDTGSQRIVNWNEIECEMFDRPLTMDDKEVVLNYDGETIRYDITVTGSRRTLTLIGAQFADGTTSRQLAKFSPMPTDIVREEGKIFLYWLDTYGNKYEDFTMTDKDIILKAVYAEEEKSQNYALGKVCTASEQGFDPAGFGLDRLTDGISSGYNAWGSNAHDSADTTVWVQVDLGEVKTINEVDLFERGDGVFFPSAYYIEVSEDGTNYTKVFNMDFDEKTTDGISFFGTRYCHFEDVAARYVRITATRLTHGGNPPYYLDLAEIEVYYNG